MLTTLFVSILCAFAPTAAITTEAISAASDTTRYYFIDYERIDAADFNGSQLVGKKIVAYTVDTIKTANVNDDLSIRQGGDPVVIMHNIRTEEGQKQPDNLGGHIVNLQKDEPLYIVDGVVVPAEEVKKMDMQTIESMSVLQAKNAIAQYGQAARLGAVIIQTKKSSKKPELSR